MTSTPGDGWEGWNAHIAHAGAEAARAADSVHHLGLELRAVISRVDRLESAVKPSLNHWLVLKDELDRHLECDHTMTDVDLVVEIRRLMDRIEHGEATNGFLHP